MTKAVLCDVFFSCLQRKISNETVMMLENHIQTEIWKKIGLGSIKSKGFDVKKIIVNYVRRSPRPKKEQYKINCKARS